MHKDSLLQTRVKSELKQAADELFCSMGLTTSDAIRIFITECVAKQSFPFEITPSTKKSTGKDFGILNPYASPMKRAKERDAWISALVSAPEMMIGNGLIGDTNIEGDRTYNLSDDERDDFQGSDEVNRGFAFDNELFAGLVNDEPLRGNARPAETEGESGKRNAANAVAVSGERGSARSQHDSEERNAAAADAVSGERSSARAQYDSEERNAAAADTATMSAESITGKRINAGSTGTAGAQRAGSGAATRALDTSAATKASSAGAGTSTGVGAGATAQHIAKQHSNTGKHKIADEQHNPPAPHKTRSSRNSASHAKTAPHANANTEHKAHSPHVLKKPLLGENYHAYKEK